MYLDNGTISEMFGKIPRTRLISFFVTHPIDRYQMRDLVKHTQLCRQTITKEVNPLIRFGLVIKERKKYRTNIDGAVFKGLVELNKAITKQVLEYEMQSKQKAQDTAG